MSITRVTVTVREDDGTVTSAIIEPNHVDYSTENTPAAAKIIAAIRDRM